MGGVGGKKEEICKEVVVDGQSKRRGGRVGSK